MPEQRTSNPVGTSPSALEGDSNFQQCLELLRGPGDERRFVGLLLVTRLLPKGSDDAVRRVLDALGMNFLQRLLLPLRRAPQAPTTHQPHPAPASAESSDAAQQQATCVGLALAILAAACRLPDVAAGPDVREMVPLLLRVVQHCGVTPLMLPGGGGGDTTADAGAVSDALECLVAAVAVAPQPTCDAMDHARALDALAAWLTAAAAALTALPSAEPAAEEAEAVAEARHNGALLAMALLERLLVGRSLASGSARAVALLAEHPAAAARIMAALAALVGNPSLLLSPSPPPRPATAAAAAAATPAAQEHQANSTGSSAASSGEQQGQGSAGKAGAAAGGAINGGAAQLQLEALHLLLLLMRACQEPAAAAVAAEFVRLDRHPVTHGTGWTSSGESWSVAVRRGLGWMLRSRVPSALKHAALELAAHTAELAGEAWLLGRRVPVTKQGERPEAFLQLLTETLKIETGLLLHDALHPHRTVPGGMLGLRSAARAHAPAPQPSQRLMEELAARAAKQRAAEAAAVKAAVDAAEAAAAAGGTSGAGTALPAIQQGEQEEGAREGGGSGAAEAMEVEEEQEGDAGSLAAVVAAPVPTVLAGERALTLLPACFRLWEACVEAVAADAAAADGAIMDVDVEPGAAAPAVAVQPMLSDAVLQRLLATFDDIADTLLQFFETAAEQDLQQRQQAQQPQQPQQQLSAANATPAAHTGATPTPAAAATAAAEAAAAAEQEEPAAVVPPGLLLGAARVLGRYLAEAPGAARGERVLRGLPLVMAVRGGGGVSGGAGGGEAGQEAFGLAFLLPGLLQATSPGVDGRTEVATALRASAPALDACVAYLANCVQRAAAAAPHLERLLLALPGSNPSTPSPSTSSTAALAAAHSEAAGAEAGMADAAMLLLNLLEPAALAAGGEGAAVVAARTGEPLGYAWEAVSRCPAPAASAAAAASAADRDQLVAAAAAAAAHLPPLLAVLQPVCWLVQRWAEARARTLQVLASLDVLSHPSGPGTAAAELARAQLAPRALLCAVCLATVTLAATMRRLSDSLAAQDKDQQQQQQLDHTLTAAAAAAILPPPLVQGLCSTSLAAASAGASLEFQQLSVEHEREDYRSRGGGADASMEEAGEEAEAAEAAGWLTAAGARDDYPGDGEVCWSRLLGAVVQLVEMSDTMRGLTRGSLWLQRMAAASAAGGRAAGGQAAQELLMDVNLALLLQVMNINR